VSFISRRPLLKAEMSALPDVKSLKRYKATMELAPSTWILKSAGNHAPARFNVLTIQLFNVQG
jgi:hypothetical protein